MTTTDEIRRNGFATLKFTDILPPQWWPEIRRVYRSLTPREHDEVMVIHPDDPWVQVGLSNPIVARAEQYLGARPALNYYDVFQQTRHLMIWHGDPEAQEKGSIFRAILYFAAGPFEVKDDGKLTMRYVDSGTFIFTDRNPSMKLADAVAVWCFINREQMPLPSRYQLADGVREALGANADVLYSYDEALEGRAELMRKGWRAIREGY